MTWMKKDVSAKKKKRKRYKSCGGNKKNETGIMAWYNFTCKTCITAPQLQVKSRTSILHFKTELLLQFLGIKHYI